MKKIEFLLLLTVSLFLGNIIEFYFVQGKINNVIIKLKQQAGFLKNTNPNKITNINNVYRHFRKITKIKISSNDINDISTNAKIHVGIFGSTGSIGVNALNIIRECNKINNNLFQVDALYVNKNIKKLYEQAKEFLPQYLCIHDETKYEEIKNLIQRIQNYNPIILVGNEGMKEICRNKHITNIIIGIDSFQGIYSTIHAIQNEKIIGLANKESIVSAGTFLKKLMNIHKNSLIIPVDSEHSAIFQSLNNNNVLKTKCLQDNFTKINNINKILLCASGGPFQNLSLDELKNVTVDKALQHPKWKMGKKITIDSATMMNKGLEVIEAHFLFDILFDNIEIVVHKECIVHSAVEFVDKSVISQMYYPDMQIPILYALTWPQRIKTNLKSLNLFEVSSLTFQKASLQRFPCIKLAYDAGKEGNLYTTVLNASNEVVNGLFLNGKIRYFDISEIIKETLDMFQPQEMATNTDDLMHQVISVHNWAQQKARHIYDKRCS